MASDFSRPHYVALTFLPAAGNGAPDFGAAGAALHQSYYCHLKPQCQVLLYGRTLNNTGLHIILHVASDHHLWQILKNDPLLNSESLKIDRITPFVISAY